MGGWGTWEELLLGGAIFRYGTRDWNVVAGELRERIDCPIPFTPEVCKAKFEDLQQRYSGSTDFLYEELRKRRVEELKKAIERSGDSIGSLKSKIEDLEAEKNEEKDDCENGLESPASHLPLQKLERVKSSTKETSKDGLSAGSFTHETRTNWSPESQVSAASADNNETKLEVLQPTEQAKVSQSKLEVLEAEKNEKKHDCENGIESPVSHVPSQKLERVKSSTKETSKDGLSTGSFTHETRTNWSPKSQVPAASADDNETKPEVLQSTEQAKVPQSKLEILEAEKNEKKHDCENGLESLVSHAPSQKLERVKSCTKETSKDGLSARSFTRKTRTKWSHESQIPAASADDSETKPEVLQSTEQAKVSQSKLEVLKAEKNEKKDDCENGLESPVSHLPSQKLESVKTSIKETSKDGLSSGSFTHETRTNWSPETQVPAASADDNKTKPEVLQSTEQDKVSGSKLEVLKDEKKEKKDDCQNGLESPVSHLPSQKLVRVESSAKETSKEGLSVGSFTQETRTNWSPESQVPAASSDDNETKPEVSQSTEQAKVLNGDNLELTLYEIQVGCRKKRRGKRKRKDCGRNIMEAASLEESDLLDAVDVMSWRKESSNSNCGDVAKSSADVDNKKSKNPKKHSAEDMIKILDSIFETEGASAFRRRLDGQKRGKYKKMIQKHMDFDTIRSRISSRTIESTRELYRDLLLLTNNALVFYSKITHEYKTALLLRGIVAKKMRESLKGSTSSSKKVTEPNESMKLPVHHNLHVKPRSVRPGNRKIIAKAVGGDNSASSQGAKKPIKADSSPSVESLNVTKKAFGRQKKVEPVSSSQKTATPVKGRKRVRTK